jgi:recombination protein RecA
VAGDRKEKLEFVISAIQSRWGLRAIEQGDRQPQAAAYIPTGFPALDQALGIGGIARGRINEIVSIPTSGAATLALKIAANAQGENGKVVYIDVAHAFDPDYAYRCDVNLQQLMLVHPCNVQQGIAMLPDFAVNGGFDLLVFDMPLYPPMEPAQQQQLSSALGRLLAPLSKSGCPLLFLSSLPPESDASLTAYPRYGPLPHYATIRLLIQKGRWLYRRQDVRGYEAQAVVLKNKLGRAGKAVRIAITFNGTVDGDGT